MNDPQPISPRARLQELLAIPDRNRTDAEWDELNELEISLAVGNRIGGPDPNRRPTGVMGKQNNMMRQQPGQNQGKPGGGKKFHKRPRRRNGSGNGNGGGPQAGPQ